MTADIPASTILSFRTSMRGCRNCAISSNLGGPLPWTGDLNPHYAILGESPGRTEGREGSLFVGDSAAILRHWLKQVGIDPSSVTYLNSVACMAQRTPTDQEMANCRPWVHGQLEFIRPQVLITLGTIAFHQIRDGAKWPKLANLHGKPMFHPTYNFWIWPTYSPQSYLKGRNKTYEKKITDDLDALVAWEANDRHPLECCYVCADELYRYNEHGVGLCERHAMRAGQLWPEDVLSKLDA